MGEWRRSEEERMERELEKGGIKKGKGIGMQRKRNGRGGRQGGGRRQEGRNL